MVTAFMGLTSSRDVTGLAHATNLKRIPSNLFPVHQPDRLATRSPLPCHISTDALVRIERNTAEANMTGYQLDSDRADVRETCTGHSGCLQHCALAWRFHDGLGRENPWPTAIG